tara:strand:+ start:263 stop:859 length:597 start_codon:yes stop_codon:yes gene_type:complete
MIGEKKILSENKLVTLVNNGDERALNFLLQRIYPRGVGIAYPVLGSRSLAEEAAQEGLIRIFSKFDDFEEGSNFGAWTYRIFRNVALSWRRREIRHAQATPIRLEQGDFYLLGISPVDHTEKRDFFLERRIHKEIWEAIARLPPKQQKILEQREFQYDKYGEIAEKLGIPIGTVMSCLYRSRKRLVKDLASFYNEEYL